MAKKATHIKKAFGDKLIGNAAHIAIICETIALLPENLINRITAKVWMIVRMEDAWAFTFRGEELAGQHLIIFSEDLFEQDWEDIKYTILHEIGHVILGHRNSIGRRQSQREIENQEREADEFAKSIKSP